MAGFDRRPRLVASITPGFAVVTDSRVLADEHRRTVPRGAATLAAGGRRLALPAIIRRRCGASRAIATARAALARHASWALVVDPIAIGTGRQRAPVHRLMAERFAAVPGADAGVESPQTWDTAEGGRCPANHSAFATMLPGASMPRRFHFY